MNDDKGWPEGYNDHSTAHRVRFQQEIIGDPDYDDRPRSGVGVVMIVAAVGLCLALVFGAILFAAGRMIGGL